MKKSDIRITESDVRYGTEVEFRATIQYSISQVVSKLMLENAEFDLRKEIKDTLIDALYKKCRKLDENPI